MNHSNDHNVEIAASKVLIIDDDPTYRFLLRGMLQKSGVKTIVEADNDIEGLAPAQSTNPDMILLDVVTLWLDGFVICQKLRTETQHANTTIFIQTGLKGEQERLEFFAAGAADVIIKPLNLPEFSVRVPHDEISGDLWCAYLYHMAACLYCCWTHQRTGWLAP
jgi:DNA-binding response OmpR family regulator